LHNYCSVGRLISGFAVHITGEEVYWQHKTCQHLAGSQQSLTQYTYCSHLLTAVHNERESVVQMISCVQGHWWPVIS